MTTLSIILFIFCSFQFHFSTASDYNMFGVNYEIEGVKGLNPLNDKIYFPEWNPVNDPVYEPKTSSKKGSLLVETASFSEENVSSGPSSSRSSIYFEEDSTSESSISPKSYIPEKSYGPLKLWYIRHGLPLSNTHFIASAYQLYQSIIAIRNFGLPEISATYSIISHRFRNYDKLISVIPMTYLLKIERNVDYLKYNLKVLGKLIEANLNNESIIGVQLNFDNWNIVTISVIVDLEAETQNNFSIRLLLSKSFNDFSVDYYKRIKC